MRNPRVVLIADDPVFSRDLLVRWQAERNLPGLTVMTTDLLSSIREQACDLVMIGAVRNSRLISALKFVDAGDYPVICLLDTAADAKTVKSAHPRLYVMQHHEAWLDSLLLLATECLKRVDLTERVRRAEQSALVNSRGAALGRYMVESRHDLNNSLTSVLGNAELLLMEADSFPASARDQLQTIHEMALQMHEVMQRISSVAAESRNAENSSQDETKKPSHVPTTVH